MRFSVTCKAFVQLRLLSPTRRPCFALNNKHAWSKPSAPLDFSAFSPACFTHINPQKTSASEGTLLLFHAAAFSLLLSCYVCDIYISTVTLSLILKHLCYPIYMMLLLYFRPVTEKKTPLLRNHSICSGPQRFPFVLIILFSETSISNGLARTSHSKLWLIS